MRFTCLVLRVSAIGLFLILYPFAGLGQGAHAFELKSTAFTAGGMIPSPYTCQGKDISPPLVWSGTPKNTKSYALICDDPDAPMGTWVHWVFYKISPSCSSLPEALEKTERPALGGIHGKRASATSAPATVPALGDPPVLLQAPCPGCHLSLGSGASKKDILEAMEGHILAKAELIGTYRKK